MPLFAWTDQLYAPLCFAASRCVPIQCPGESIILAMPLCMLLIMPFTYVANPKANRNGEW